MVCNCMCATCVLQRDVLGKVLRGRESKETYTGTVPAYAFQPSRLSVTNRDRDTQSTQTQSQPSRTNQPRTLSVRCICRSYAEVSSAAMLSQSAIALSEGIAAISPKLGPDVDTALKEQRVLWRRGCML